MIGAWGVVPSTLAFILLTAVVLSAHLLYAEALVANKKHSRIAGQAKHWLGNGPETIAGVIQALQVFGSNLAYIILGGEFLAVLAHMAGFEIPVLFWQVAFWLTGGMLVLYGLKLVARVEAYLVWLLVAIIVFIVAVFTLQIDFSIIFTIPTRWTFEPYGVILFALLGTTSLPEVADVVNYRRQDVFKSVIRGTLVAAVLTYGFGITAWLASGGTLGRDPAEIIGLLPPVLAFILPLFGFLAVMTSFITSALDLRNMFHLDYHFTNAISWVVALGVPFTLLFLTSRDFLATIGLVGSMFGAALAILVSFMGRAALRRGGPIKKWCTLWWWREATPIVITIFFLVGGIAWIYSK
jgi:amino acid permease